jgi:hypothetical protein
MNKITPILALLALSAPAMAQQTASQAQFTTSLAGNLSAAAFRDLSTYPRWLSLETPYG